MPEQLLNSNGTPVIDNRTPRGYELPDRNNDTVIDCVRLGSSVTKIDADISALENIVAGQAFSNSAAYAVGDYCVKDKKMYRCTVAIENGEEWNAEHWTEIIVPDEIKEIVASLAENSNAITGLRNILTGNADLTYSANATYAIGDYCNKDNKLYKCLVAIETPEEWNAEHWTEIIVPDEIKEIVASLAVNSNAITGLRNILIGNADLTYSANATYAIGDYCNKDNKLYKCLVAIETPEEWDAEHWEEISAIDEFVNIWEEYGRIKIDIVDDVTLGSSTVRMPATDKTAIFIPTQGVYVWDADADDAPDGETCVLNAAGDAVGRWKIAMGGMDFYYNLKEDLVDEIRSYALSGSATITWPSMAAYGGTATGNIPIEGVCVGDVVTVYSPSMVDKLTYMGYVETPNVVTVRAVNTSNAAITPAASVWYAYVHRNVI